VPLRATLSFVRFERAGRSAGAPTAAAAGSSWRRRAFEAQNCLLADPALL